MTRRRREKEQRCTGIAGHLGTTVRAAALRQFGRAAAVGDLTPIELHTLTEALWARQAARDEAAQRDHDALPRAVQDAVLEGLLR